MKVKLFFILLLVFFLTGCLGGITVITQYRYYMVDQCTDGGGDNMIDLEALVEKEIPLSPRQEVDANVDADASVIPKKGGVVRDLIPNP